ncbi:MAG: DUF1684 domain-containing protein [Balneolaceae bacterium]
MIPFKIQCIILLAFGFMLTGYSQATDSVKINEIEAYRDSLNTEFQNPENSPLISEDFENFTGLDFFPIDLAYYLKAKFVRTPDQEPFKMATTTAEYKVYEKYGEVHFELHDEEIVLNVYQSHALRETEKYRDYLFLPFKDTTNGSETYGGGRYLELWIPDGDSITVDFNKAYNPYCVYNLKYSCPLVPKANWMNVPVYAGVKDFKK